ncbi:MAG: hypothetical protein QOJ02_3405 [Acidobacteriota bacterium]|nr:hypothetical protein [Acidobacteriota bacterium]
MSRPLSIMRHSPQRVKASSQDSKDSGARIHPHKVDEVEASSQNPKDTSQSSKWIPVLTALIAMIGTIGVSFIAIVPQLRRGDVEKFERLEKELASLRENNVSTVNPKDGVSTSTDKKQTIRGTVMSKDGRQQLAGVEVYLLPEGKYLTYKTNDSGVFNFPEIPLGQYSIITRDSVREKSGRGLLDKLNGKMTVNGALIEYYVQQ